MSQPLKLKESPFQSAFARHETFHFRYGWLKKGVDAILRDGEAFSNADAPVVLGVGKNMVQSIRYWCLASRLIRPVRNKGNQRTYKYEPTQLALNLLASSGWDPYLEREGTLWLLHWLIASNHELATSWYWAFSIFDRLDFTSSLLLTELQRYVEQNCSPVAPSSLKKDVQCILRMYLPSSASARNPIEDSLDCPLVELKLLQRTSDSRIHFRLGHKSTLPSEILGFSTCDFRQRRETRERTLSIHELLYAEGSPGRVFKLPESALLFYLEALRRRFPGWLRWDETAGLKQVYFQEERQPLELLEAYYETST